MIEKKGHGPPPPITEVFSQNDPPHATKAFSKAITSFFV
jgi:hypothetical protein